MVLTVVKFAAMKAARPGVGKAAAAAAHKVSKSQESRPGGLSKPVPVSPALKKFLGTGEASRIEAIKKLWAYIKDRKLQDPMAKKEIVCDDNLRQLFPDKDRINFLEIPGLLSAHFPKKGQS